MKHEKIFTENFLRLRNFPKKFQRRAQGLSMNLIVMAAIALLILVILAFIFMGRMGIFGTGVAECRNQGGTCMLDPCGTPDTVSAGYDPFHPADAACDKYSKGRTPYCCIKIEEEVV